MTGRVYILQSDKNGSYYIGSTIHLLERLEEHNNGTVTATKHLLPWKLVFSKEYQTIKEARQVEYRLKKLKSREIIKKIIQEKDIRIKGR